MSENKNDNSLPYLETGSSQYLLKRFETDMLAVYRQMEVLQIVFNNLKGSWLAISLAHKAFKSEREEER